MHAERLDEVLFVFATLVVLAKIEDGLEAGISQTSKGLGGRLSAAIDLTVDGVEVGNAADLVDARRRD